MPPYEACNLHTDLLGNTEVHMEILILIKIALHIVDLYIQLTVTLHLQYHRQPKSKQ